MNYIENFCLLAGRILLGLYFILPGLQKITDFDGMSQYMDAHNVPMVPVLLIITIVIQLAAGAALIVGYKGKIAAFLLAGLTLVISIYMHNFWAMEESAARGHEMQNFVKNMAIMAGLLYVAALGTGKFSLDNRSTNTPAS
ncbi:MAG: putative oxidoreductase [Paraglaciecola sp.]|jgi:putative oxidoreductase